MGGGVTLLLYVRGVSLLAWLGCLTLEGWDYTLPYLPLALGGEGWLQKPFSARKFCYGEWLFQAVRASPPLTLA